MRPSRTSRSPAFYSGTRRTRLSCRDRDDTRSSAGDPRGSEPRPARAYRAALAQRPPFCISDTSSGRTSSASFVGRRTYPGAEVLPRRRGAAGICSSWNLPPGNELAVHIAREPNTHEECSSGPAIARAPVHKAGGALVSELLLRGRQLAADLALRLPPEAHAGVLVHAPEIRDPWTDLRRPSLRRCVNSDADRAEEFHDHALFFLFRDLRISLRWLFVRRRKVELLARGLLCSVARPVAHAHELLDARLELGVERHAAIRVGRSN